MAEASREPVTGTVKFFSGEKGFGFVTPDGGGKDVFVHAKVLERAGLRALAPEQRVRMTISMGQKGPQADTVTIL
ncbi:MAG: cold shock domain-containing protein [Alphaproteobacteria bacterium]